MMITLFTCAGFILIVVGLWTGNYIYKKWESGELDIRWRRIVRIAAVAGIALGIASYFMSYSYGPDVRIIGFPIAAAAFKLENGKWLDYVSFLTFPFMIGNILIFVALPQMVVALAYIISKKSEQRKSNV